MRVFRYTFSRERPTINASCISKPASNELSKRENIALETIIFLMLCPCLQRIAAWINKTGLNVSKYRNDLKKDALIGLGRDN